MHVARIMANQGHTQKYIAEDIYFMRDRLGAPIEYSYEKNGYYYSSDSYFLPENMMSEGEIFSLFMSQEIIRGLGDSPIRNQLDVSFNVSGNSIHLV